MHTGANHFGRGTRTARHTNPEQLIPYAESKDAPQPKLGVCASGAALVIGGLAILAGSAPRSARFLAAFCPVTTPLMHDCWAVPEEVAARGAWHSGRSCSRSAEKSMWSAPVTAITVRAIFLPAPLNR